MVIEYRYNTSSEKEILTHLQSVDEDFVVPLSRRVNIDEYAHKLYTRAVRAESYLGRGGRQLIGLVAYYVSQEMYFITNVSVCKPYVSHGIATKLLQLVKHNAKDQNINKLEVEADEALIPFYSKNGFVVASKAEGNNYKMVCFIM